MKTIKERLGRINWRTATPFALAFSLLALIVWAETDSMKPTGVDSTDGRPVTASTAYNTLVGALDDYVELDGGSGTTQTVEKDQATTTGIVIDNTNATGNAYLRVNSQAVSADIYTDSATDSGGLKIQNSTYALNSYQVGARTITDKLVASGREIQVASCDQLTGNVNNWAGPPTDSDYTAQLWKISSDAARTITGIVGPANGTQRSLILFNQGAFTISLSHQSGSSSAANQFYFSTAATVSLASGSSIELYYDDSANFWFDLNSSVKSSLISGAVITNAETTAVQTITGTSNNAVELNLTNNNAGNSTSSKMGVNSVGASLAMYTLSSGYAVSAEQNAAKISASTGANGFIIENSAADPIIFKEGSDEHFRINDQGFAWGQASQNITAVGNTITPTASLMYLNPDANYVLTSTPQITAGIKIGQLLYLSTANGEANTVTLTDEGGAAGSTLQLAAATRVVADLNVLVLMWQGTYWLEDSFADN